MTMAAFPGAGSFSDAARRISDAVNQAIVDGHRNRWMAFALEDGTGDGVHYDTKADAIRHMANKYRAYCYVIVPWDHCPPRAAEIFLHVHRQLKALGQHPDDEMAKTVFMMDSRLEAYPRFDPRTPGRTLRNPITRRERRSKGGVILP